MTDRQMWWLRVCHANFKAGQRTVDVVEGERAYQAWRKRVQRSKSDLLAAS